ncbi:MAG: hypothetical protein HY794_15430 [Desulfarculus sp.]|nr:hypothetical protein [Desulfarculus sp.]
MAAAPPGAGPAPGGDVLILGGGRFGRLAAQRLGGRVLALAEVAPAPDLAGLGVPVWPLEAVAAAQQALASPRSPAWLVPCVPVHFLVHWLLASLAGQGARPLPVPPEVEPGLPMLGRGQEGQLFLSLTDTLCPDDCPEPASVCPKTGQPRGLPLYRRLMDLSLPGWGVAVLRSHQLAPGVGGLAASEMLALRQRLAGQGGRWLVATACRCHGVLSGLELSPSRA